MIEQHLMIRTDDSLPLCSTPYLTPASQWSCSPRPLASAGSGNISGIDEMSSSESDSTIPADTSDNRDVSKSTDSRHISLHSRLVWLLTLFSLLLQWFFSLFCSGHASLASFILFKPVVVPVACHF
jgi:hypothetical protein